VLPNYPVVFFPRFDCVIDTNVCKVHKPVAYICICRAQSYVCGTLCAMFIHRAIDITTMC
jgi:hypothetical protein